MSTTSLRRFRWYGRVLATDLPFVVRLPEALGEADVTLKRVEDSAWPAGGIESGRRIFPADPKPGDDSWLEAFVEGDRHRLCCVGRVHFEILGNRIEWRLLGGTPSEAEAFFLGLVSALWLEMNGALCLHGAAVVTSLGAVGFLGFNRAGKSSLAASFLTEGGALLTDDVLALDVEPSRIVARPGFPQIRLWPASAEALVGDARELEPVHPDFDKRRVPIGPQGLGEFHDRPEQLRALFLPDRTGEVVSLSRISPRDAAIELVRHSFLGALGEAAIGVASRFERIVAVSERVPVFRLTYPNGLERLGSVRRAITECLETL